MTLGVNDYPTRGSCPGACSRECPCGAGGSWACCNCTSFVCWRLQNDLHRSLGSGYGDAYTWAGAARHQGIPVNGTPAVGAVYQLPAGVNGAAGFGHVAITLAVGPGSAFGASIPAGKVLVEDYNWSPCGYARHVMPIPGANFLHFNDLVPPPPATCSPACDCCHTCVGTTCLPLCAGGSACVNCTCQPPPPPPKQPGLFVPVLLLGGAAGGLWYARNRLDERGFLARDVRPRGTRQRLGAVRVEGFGR